MNVLSRTGIKYQPDKWLLGIIMLFSIFTFAGFSGGIDQNFPQAVKTEVTLSKNVKAVKLTISYKRGVELCRHQHSETDFNQNFASLNHTYTQLVKVKLNQLSMQKPHLNNHFHYFRINIPENSDDEYFFARIA